MQTGQATTYRWVILALNWLAVAAMYSCITQIPPLAQFITSDLGIDKASMGLLYSAPLFSFALVAFFAGAISDIYGPRIVACWGMSLVAVAALGRGIVADSFSMLLICNLIMGVGIGCTMPNLPKLNGDWFASAEQGIATSVFSTGISLGSSAGLMLTIPVVLKIMGDWQHAFYAWGTVALVSAVLLWLFCRNSETYTAPKTARKLFIKEVYTNSTLQLVAVVFFCACWVFFVAVGWVPTILASKGASPALAGAMGGMVPLFGLLANLFSPALSTKIRNRTVFIWGSFLLGSLTVIVMIFSPIQAFWVLLAVLGISCNTAFVLCLFMLPLDLIPKKNVGAASGLLMTIGYTAALIGPWLTGYIWDTSQSITVVLTSLIFVQVTGMVLSFFIPEPFKRQEMVTTAK